MRDGRHAQRNPRRSLRFGRLLRELELSDAQRSLVAEASALAAPVRQDLRAKVRSIIEDARTRPATTPRTNETRVAVREQVKAAFTAARASLEVPARRFLDSLTPDQRAKLEAKAKAHGRTFDEQRLLRAFEGMLLAPRQGMQRGGMRSQGMRGPGMHRDGIRPQGMQRGGMRSQGMRGPGMRRDGMRPQGMQRGGMRSQGMRGPGMHRDGMGPQGMQRGGMRDEEMRCECMRRPGMHREDMPRPGMHRRHRWN